MAHRVGLIPVFYFCAQFTPCPKISGTPTDKLM